MSEKTRTARYLEALTGEGVDYTPEMLRALADDLANAQSYILGCADALADHQEGDDG